MESPVPQNYPKPHHKRNNFFLVQRVRAQKRTSQKS